MGSTLDTIAANVVRLRWIAALLSRKNTFKVKHVQRERNRIAVRVPAMKLVGACRQVSKCLSAFDDLA